MAFPRPARETSINKCIAETLVRAERKTFHIGRYENSRGGYLRVTETGPNGYSNIVVIPLCGVADMICAFDSMLQSTRE